MGESVFDFLLADGYFRKGDEEKISRIELYSASGLFLLTIQGNQLIL